MDDLSFHDCVEFQDCFLFEGHFTPFEDVKDFHTYYPRVLLGEIGGLINLACKQVRSVNIYTEEITDECADIFVYLLLFGRMLEIHDRKPVLGLIQEDWNQKIDGVLTEEDFYNECRSLIKKIDRFLDPEAGPLYNPSYFREIFWSLRRASRYITNREWQQVINDFHQQVLYKHTDVNNYTIDGLYRGCFRIHLDKLLGFAD